MQEIIQQVNKKSKSTKHQGQGNFDLGPLQMIKASKNSTRQQDQLTKIKRNSFFENEGNFNNKMEIDNDRNEYDMEMDTEREDKY